MSAQIPRKKLRQDLHVAEMIGLFDSRLPLFYLRMQENEAVCCVYYCSCTSVLDPRGHPRKLGGSPMKIKLKHELSREVPILVGFSYLSAFLPLWFNNS